MAQIKVKGCKSCPFFGHEMDQTYCTLDNQECTTSYKDTIDTPNSLTLDDYDRPNNCPLLHDTITVINQPKEYN